MLGLGRARAPLARVGTKVYTSSTVLPSQGLLSQASRFIERNPFGTQLFLCTFKTSCCDVMAQTCIEGKSFKDIDWRRNSIYTAFGFLYLGGAQYFVYVHGFKKLFNPAVVEKFGNQTIRQKLTNLPGIKSLLGQTLVDIGIHQPLMYLPSFYVVKEFMQAVNEVGTGEKGEYGSAKSIADFSFVEIANNAINKYIPNAVQDNIVMSSFWAPFNMVAFSIPTHLRMPAIHSMALIWTTFLSAYKSGYLTVESIEAEIVGLPDERKDTVISTSARQTDSSSRTDS